LETGCQEAYVSGSTVRQGCSLSPLLYIIYDEAMAREASRDCEIGIKVGGKIVNMIRYAVDKAVVASSQKGLHELMTRLNKITKEYGMKIDEKKTKTKTMCIPQKGQGKVRLQIDGGDVEQVNQFKHLGSWITDDRYSVKDVRVEIAMGKAVFMGKIVDRKVALRAKEAYYKVYSVECGTGCSGNLLEAFEIWIRRRMLKISWRDKKTNEGVLMRVAEARSMLGMIHRRKCNWIGHILRHVTS